MLAAAAEADMTQIQHQQVELVVVEGEVLEGGG
jgi:hypothetical protein